MKGRKILVTGGAGFIGSNLVEALYGENDVTVLDNLHTGKKSNIANAMKHGLKFIEGDAKDITSIKQDFDNVFHLGIYSASPMYREDPHLVAEVIQGITSVLEYCRERKIPLVFASTSSIYSGVEPPHREDIVPGVTDFYTEARIAAERVGELYSKLFELNVSAMRFFSVYGYNDVGKGRYANLITQFILAMKQNNQPVIYGNGEQRRDFVFVTDVVDALIRASDSKGFNVYNVGTGINYSLNEVVAKLNEILGKSVEPKFIPMPVKNYVNVTLADTTKSKRELGFEPKVKIDQGVGLLKKSLER